MDSQNGVTRRRLLIALGSGLGLFGGGGAYVYWSLQGDSGGYTAPATQPVVTTRGLLDAADEPAFKTGGTWSFDDASDVFLFVHGFSTDAETARDNAYTAQVALDGTRSAPVIAYSWDSDVDWERAKANAEANSTPLAQWLVEWAETDGRPVHLLAHSLGARVTGETLRVLADQGATDALASVSLLGGAIPYDSVVQGSRYGDAIGAVDAPVSNFYSHNDKVLSWIYRASDRTHAVGHAGTRDAGTLPDGYRDVNVSDLVADHYSYFEPGEGCLARVVAEIE
jgi:esterase/lipase superfamily enzyme